VAEATMITEEEVAVVAEAATAVAAVAEATAAIVTKRCRSTNMKFFSAHLCQHLHKKYSDAQWYWKSRITVDGFGDSWLHLGYPFHSFGSSFSFSFISWWPAGSLSRGNPGWPVVLLEAPKWCSFDWGHMDLLTVGWSKGGHFVTNCLVSFDVRMRIKEDYLPFQYPKESCQHLVGWNQAASERWVLPAMIESNVILYIPPRYLDWKWLVGSILSSDWVDWSFALMDPSWFRLHGRYWSKFWKGSVHVDYQPPISVEASLHVVWQSQTTFEAWYFPAMLESNADLCSAKPPAFRYSKGERWLGRISSDSFLERLSDPF